jgi:hypothetical protein
MGAPVIGANRAPREGKTMNARILAEYLRLRRNGCSGSYALRAARTLDAFTDAENDGLVKLECEPECDYYDDSYVDTWEHCSQTAKDRAKKEIADRIDRDGHWILVGYYLDTDGTWERADCIGGFIGDDWQDSGYDVDIRQACLDQLEAQAQCGADELASRATYAGPFWRTAGELTCAYIIALDQYGPICGN